MNVLIIDNYDSFTYNVAMYLRELGARVEVRRNDAISIADIEALKVDKIVISPGPGRPVGAGISIDVIKTFAERKPILGVCLGHQCLASLYGANIVAAKRLMHGKVSLIEHEDDGLFKNLPTSFKAMRYHSLLVDLPSLPEEFRVTAWSVFQDPDTGKLEREIMGIEHTSLPLFGVQFHPESILSEAGHQLFQNFLKN